MTKKLKPHVQYRMPFLLLLLFLSPVAPLFSQVDLSGEFLQTLEAAQIDFLEPVEQQFKTIRTRSNPLLTCDLSIRKRKSQLEIRYAILPYSDTALDDIPHVKCLTTAMHLASNSENSQLAVHSLEDLPLRQQYNADWGGMVYFQPKRGFSNKRYCKMLALYAEGKGMALVFFLFDDTEDDPGDWAYLQFKN